MIHRFTTAGLFLCMALLGSGTARAANEQQSDSPSSATLYRPRTASNRFCAGSSFLFAK